MEKKKTTGHQCNHDVAILNEIERTQCISPISLALCSTVQARRLIPFEKALEKKILPIMVVAEPGRGEILRVVAPKLSQANQHELKRELRFIAEREIDLIWVEVEGFEESIIRAYVGADEVLLDRLQAAAKSKAVVVTAQTTHLTLESGEGDVAKLLTALLHNAAVRGASDIHLCPSSNGSVIKLRVDGDLLVQDAQPYSRTIHDQLVARLKVLSGLDVTKKQQPQDGTLAFSIPGGRAYFARLSSIPTLYGESIAIRLLHKKDTKSLAELGLTEGVKNALYMQLSKRGGLVVLAGPTGCGKSTTLYACLQEVRDMGLNIITVEDPIEQHLEGVTQIQVSLAHEVTYPSAIRAVLRHDPDALLIGEIRDSESAKAALEAAGTGHLTLTSLHLSSALDVIERFKTLQVDPTELAPHLLMVVNQRLLGKLCDQCKVIDLNGTRSFGTTIYQRVGCYACAHTGYIGRALVSEALIVNDQAIREAISVGASKTMLLDVIGAGSWLSWKHSLQQLLCRGEISVEQFVLFIDREYS